MTTSNVLFFACVTGLLFDVTGCGKRARQEGPRYQSAVPSGNIREYRFAVHPLHNPTKLLESYQPLVDFLNSKLEGVHLALEASREYGTFEEKYHKRTIELILPNPWQTLEAIRAGYHVIATAGNPEDFKGLFIVRKDGSIRQPADLKGKAVSYPSPTALAACIMPQYFLHRRGIDVNHEIENRYVGSQESSIMNVYLRKTAAGVTWPPPWRAFQRDHPEEAAELKVLWQTESLINNSVMVRDDVPENVRSGIRSLLLDLHKTTEGRTILAGMETGRFFDANDKTYDIVQKYVDRFEKDVRKVRQP